MAPARRAFAIAVCIAVGVSASISSDSRAQVKALDASHLPSPENNFVYPLYDGAFDARGFRFAGRRRRAPSGQRLNLTAPENQNKIQALFHDAGAMVAERPALLRTIANMQRSAHELQRREISLRAEMADMAREKKNIKARLDAESNARRHAHHSATTTVRILRQSLDRAEVINARLRRQNARLLRTLSRIGQIERGTLASMFADNNEGLPHLNYGPDVERPKNLPSSAAETPPFTSGNVENALREGTDSHGVRPLQVTIIGHPKTHDDTEKMERLDRVFRSIRRRPGGGRAAVESLTTPIPPSAKSALFGLALPNPATMLRQIARLIPMPALVELEQKLGPPEPIMLDEKAERLEHVVMLLLEQKDKGRGILNSLKGKLDRAVRAALTGLLDSRTMGYPAVRDAAKNTPMAAIQDLEKALQTPIQPLK